MSMTPPETPGPPAAAAEKPPGAYAWYVVVVLMLVYTLSFIDRKLPFILVESIKHDLRLTDTQIGLLTGAMFAIVYATVAIPIASFADRTSRKRMIAWSVFVWSSVTALGGLAQNFWQLAASRIGVAAGEAACTPAAHSMIADYFKPRFRARAIGLYFVGAQLGIVLGLALGGWINDLSNWRVAMFLCGAPGLAFTMLVLLTVREPPRAQAAPTVHAAGVAPAKLGETLRVMFKHSTFTHMMIAAILASITGGGVQAFTPAYLIRTFGLTSSEVGFSYGLVMGGAGAIGAVLGGLVGDRLRRKEPRLALFFVAGGVIIGAPCMALAFIAPSVWMFLALIFLAQVGAMIYAGPGFATIQSLVEPRMHAVASAVYLFALNGIGYSLGPLVVGMLSDWLVGQGSPNSLRVAILAVILPKLWAGGHYLMAARGLGRSPQGAAVQAST